MLESTYVLVIASMAVFIVILLAMYRQLHGDHKQQIRNMRHYQEQNNTLTIALSQMGDVVHTLQLKYLNAVEGEDTEELDALREELEAEAVKTIRRAMGRSDEYDDE